MKGIDCTTAITETSGKALKAAGYEFTARYLVPAAYSWKRLTRTEAAAISGSGLKFCPFTKQQQTGFRAVRHTALRMERLLMLKLLP